MGEKREVLGKVFCLCESVGAIPCLPDWERMNTVGGYWNRATGYADDTRKTWGNGRGVCRNIVVIGVYMRTVDTCCHWL